MEHATSAQQTAAAEQGDVAAPLEHEQVMAQLGELDKLGQEGAAPVDEAEVCLASNTVVEVISHTAQHAPVATV